MDPCTQEGRIKNIEGRVNKMDDKIDRMIELSATQVQISEQQGKNINSLMKNVENLVVSKIQTDKEDEVILRVSKENEKNKKEKAMYKRWLITSIIAAGGLIFTALALYLKFGPK